MAQVNEQNALIADSDAASLMQMADMDASAPSALAPMLQQPEPQLLPGAAPSSPNAAAADEPAERLGWMLERAGAAQPSAGADSVWLSADKPLEEWCPVARTLQGGEFSDAKVAVLDCSVRKQSALSCGADGKLRLWSLSTGNCDKIFGPNIDDPSSSEVVQGCDLFADGTRAVSCGADVRVWDLSSGRCTATMAEHTKDVTTCSVSPDGSKILTGSADKLLKLWHLGGTGTVETLTGHSEQVNECHFFLGDKKALSCSKDKTLRVWDFADPDSGLELYGHNDTVLGCDLCPNGEQAVSCSGDRTVKLWNLKPTLKEKALTVQVREENDPKRKKQLKKHLNQMAFARCQKTLDFPDAKPTACRMFQDGVRLLVISDQMHTFHIFNIDTGHCLQSLYGHSSAINSCCIHDHGTKAITCGTSKLRVWDLSSRGKTHQLGHAGGGESHTSVVKELRVSPDARKALSCAYDDSLRVWDLTTGKCDMKLGEPGTHKGQVFDCAWFPDGSRVLSCGGDGSLKVWDTTNGDLLSTMKGHTTAVRGCCLFDNGAKALSCSKDATLKVWDVVSGKEMMALAGHTDLIDRCATFERDGKTYAMSASWDKTLRVWDLSNGTEVSVLKDHNKVRGFAVYDDGDAKRAVSTGSGLTLSIWNIDDLRKPFLIKQLPTGHAATVWGLEMLLDKDHMKCVTFSQDGTVRTWNLREQREEVAGRRAFHPGPMCAAAIPAYRADGTGCNYSMGNAPLLVGLGKDDETELGEIKLVDLSNLGSGPSASALALGRQALSNSGASLDVWTQWLLDAMDEDDQAQVLFLRDDKSDLPTLIHKLAADEGGAEVLRAICKKYEYEDALGLVSHAGNSMQGNALTIAINNRHEDFAKILLDDYSRHVEDSSYELTGAQLLTETDAVILFETFPSVATQFLKTVQLCRSSKSVKEGSRCDFAAENYDELMCDHPRSDPTSKSNDDDRLWWDKKLDKIWDQSRSSFDRKEKPWIKTRQDDTAYGERAQAMFLPFACARAVPPTVGAGTSTAATAIIPHSAAALLDSKSAAAGAAAAHSVAGAAGTAAKAVNNTLHTVGETLHVQGAATAITGSIAESTLGKAVGNLVGDNLKGVAPLGGSVLKNVGQMSKAMIRFEEISKKRLPFSRLLEKASSYADAEGPDIFESVVLRIIVQQKWKDACQYMHMTLFYMFLIFLVVFAFATINFTEYIKSGDPVKIFIAWATWGYSLLYIILLAKREFHQLAGGWRSMESNSFCEKLWDTFKGYVQDIWNMMDMINTVFTLLALWQMAVGARYDGSVHDGVAYESIDFHTVRCLQALAGFGGGFKILYFLRGMDFASFLINMLEHIMRDMIDFIVVLLVIIVMYMYVFHLLLHAPQGPGLDDPLAASGDNNMGFPLAPMTADHFPYNETDVQFETNVMLFFTVHNMMYGDFDMSHFDNYHGRYSWVLTLLMFMGFMLMVPTIMFNALIAIMGDTYGRVNEQKDAAGLHERAKLVLELESLMLYYDAKARGKPVFKKLSVVKRVFCLVFSLKIAYCKESAYIHVLQQEKIELEEENPLEKKVDKLDLKVVALEDALEQQTKLLTKILESVQGKSVGRSASVMIRE